MIKSYINKIKANITIYASKKTANILDGSYKSIYKGKSMNFEDLRTYIIGDNIKDIDWKASARSRNMLVRQYVAEKKHNIMLVLDSGKKMLADTEKKETKKDVALMAAGTIAYLANKNGDYIGAIYNKNNSITYQPFKSGAYNIEKILSDYDRKEEKEESTLKQNLEYISKHINKRMVIFVITDLEGMNSVDENTLKKLSIAHDILFININDAYMTGENTYDIDDNTYIPDIILKDSKLYELEKKLKEDIYNETTKKFKRYRITATEIDSNKEVTMKIIELLERHKNASIS